MSRKIESTKSESQSTIGNNDNHNGGGDVLAAAPPSVIDERRATTIPKAHAVPGAPDDYQPMAAADKQGMRVVPEDQRAEVAGALDQITEKHETLKVDLGPLAPPLGEAATLRARMEAIREVKGVAERLAVWLNDQEDICHHDAAVFLDGVAGDIEHMGKKRPGIVGRYEKVLTVVKQRRQAISDGIARKKAEKEAVASAQPKVEQLAEKKSA